MQADRLIPAIEQFTGRHGKRVGRNTRLLCPCHDDHDPSLDVAEGADGKALVICRVCGAGYKEVLAALGIEEERPANEPIATYRYQDENGTPLIEVGRFVAPNGGKQFLQRRAGAPDWKGGVRGIRRVPYHLPEVIDAVANGRAIFVNEGEKQADLLRSRGRIATTASMGAGKWNLTETGAFTGAARVFVIADDDTPGRKHADQVARDLVGRVAEVKVVNLWPKGETGRDIIDFYRAADTPEEADRALVAIIERTPPYGEKRSGLRLTRIADVQPRRVEYLDDNEMIVLGALTGLVAPGGTVKGLFGIHEAAKLAARGQRTLFVCSEDALDFIVRPRFQAAGCDGTLAFAADIEDDEGERVPHFPSDLPLLREAIERVGPRLVIIDPIASYIDPGLDMGKNNEMRLILQPLITLAREARIAILAVYHLGKLRERGAIGSVAFEDACRQVLTAARDDDDEDLRHVELTKSTVGPTGAGRMMRIVGVDLDIDGHTVEVAKLVDEGQSWKSVQALLALRKRPGPEPDKLKLARDLLIEALTKGELAGVDAGETKRDIAARAEVAEKTVWRAFDSLRKDGLASGQPVRDEFGSILRWRWVAKLDLLHAREAV